MDALGGTIRMRVTPTVTGQPIFVGIGSSADVDAYLAGVTHDTITAVAGHSTTLERSSTGVVAAESPTEQHIWVATATGAGPQQLNWSAPTEGRWAAVVMNADGPPAVATDLTGEVRAGFLLSLALISRGGSADDLHGHCADRGRCGRSTRPATGEKPESIGRLGDHRAKPRGLRAVRAAV